MINEELSELLDYRTSLFFNEFDMSNTPFYLTSEIIKLYVCKLNMENNGIHTQIGELYILLRFLCLNIDVKLSFFSFDVTHKPSYPEVVS